MVKRVFQIRQYKKCCRPGLWYISTVPLVLSHQFLYIIMIQTQEEWDEKERLRRCRPKTSKRLQREKRAEDTKERKEKLDKEQRDK